jgi:exodeoxyribonuclease VII large subunit
MSDSLLSSFDPSQARGPRAGPDVGTTDRQGPAGRGITVSALIAQVKAALAEAMPQRVCVIGELSNVKPHSSGHLYFRLKDAAAAIDAAMFRPYARTLKFRPVDGLEVVVEGRVDVYDVRGQLQLYVETMTPRGTGALELAFRQLRQKLERRGLFDAAHKAPLPRFPRAVGVITSRTGAAVRDIARTLRRRWPVAPVYLLPVPVQGDGAAEAIAAALRLMDRRAAAWEIDTIILGRGGGSLEDLWAFNEEVVARAVYAARTPIICGVGHEVDVTIAELVADVRAATPTAAAELAVPDCLEVMRHAEVLASRLGRGVAARYKSAGAALTAVARAPIFRDPLGVLRVVIQRVDELSHRLRAGQHQRLARARRRFEPLSGRLAGLHPARLAERALRRLERLAGQLAWALGGRSKRAADRLAALAARMGAVHPRHRLALADQRLGAAGRQLEAMSYRSVLHRGFSVTRRWGGEILRSVTQAHPGDHLTTELSDGTVTSRVAGGDPPRPRAARAGRIQGGAGGKGLFDELPRSNDGQGTQADV